MHSIADPRKPLETSRFEFRGTGDRTEVVRVDVGTLHERTADGNDRH